MERFAVGGWSTACWVRQEYEEPRTFAVVRVSAKPKVRQKSRVIARFAVSEVRGDIDNEI